MQWYIHGKIVDVISCDNYFIIGKHYNYRMRVIQMFIIVQFAQYDPASTVTTYTHK